jgi:hypothetical protein
MNRSIFILLLVLINVHTFVNIRAETIGSDDTGCFQSSPIPQKRLKSACPPKMPALLSHVVPTAANNNPRKPSGTLPIAIDPVTGKVVVLLADEGYRVNGFSDFGGSSDSTDISREHTAVREFNEETCLAFWEDLTIEPLCRHTTSGDQLEELAKKPLTQNVIPWFYAAQNKYFTCLLPVRYQSISDINHKIQIVRTKVRAYPFFEKRDFVWVPLEEFVGWIEKGIEEPEIPNGNGRRMSWRFFGGALQHFIDLNKAGSGELYGRVIKYLKDIIALNS